MAQDNRPRGRQKNVTGAGKGVARRGSGLGTGPVGGSGGSTGPSGFRPDSGGSYDFSPSASGRKSSRGITRAGGRVSILSIVVIAVIYFLARGGFGNTGGGIDVSGLLGGTQAVQSAQQSTQSSMGSYSSIMEALTGGSGVSSGWTDASAIGKLNTSVASGAREKRTKIVGGGKDQVTLMVYMCGTDLESNNGMATSDLQEMAKATISDKVNLLVYTGGCKSWNNNIISSSKNQLYKMEDGGKMRLLAESKAAPMTDPATLSTFIKYCVSNYPADRNMLIFWDHGGGSLSGYGYDEKFSSSGSMTLKGINTALSDAGATYDFIGFDACLMATAENALMLSNYADYLLASEETEPGVGWYYTDWLTSLSSDTSISTLELGRQIVDDFVEKCASQASGQKTTLSLIDLAELEATLPSALADFSAATCQLIQADNYKAVSSARNNSREFSSSSKLDQVDLVDLAQNMGTEEGKALASSLRSAVKYNRTSANMTNAYGLSIYFPYRRTSKVDSAVATYEAIGLDDSYSRCIQAFASVEAGGQAVSGGASSPLLSLLGGYSGSSASSSSSYDSTQAVLSLLQSMMGGSTFSVSGLTGSNSSFFGRSIELESTAEYLASNRFDESQLVWTEGPAGTEMRLSEEQWGLVNQLELNVFYDDGQGYIDLGLDNVFDLTESGALSGSYDGTWLSINDQPVAYYHESTVDDGQSYSISGYVPVMLNGVRAELILVFDNAQPNGYVSGARYIYPDGETDTIAKALTQLKAGDTLDFICDYYGYDGEYEDSYYLGERMTVDGKLIISNTYIDPDNTGAARATYRFTDVYQQTFWTPAMPWLGRAPK